MKRIAIIGCGKPRAAAEQGKVGWGIAHAHANGYRAAFPNAQWYAVDPVAGNRSAFAAQYGIDGSRCFATANELYQSVVPDAVSICTWPALHVPLAVEACQAGVKAVTVEKPIGLDGMQIIELQAAAARSGTHVAVAHQRRYERPFERAREIIQNGMLGENLVLEARVGEAWDILSWTVHWFDMASYLFDAQPTNLLAGVDHRGERRYGHAVERASVVFAEYAGRRQAVFITGPDAQPHFGITVRGTEGMMVVGNPIQLWLKSGYREEAIEGGADAFGRLFADLWNAVEHGTISRCDLRHCAIGTQLAFAAHESARTQTRVEFPLRTWFAPLEVLQHASKVTWSRKRILLLADKHHEWPGMAMSGREGLHEALVALGHDVRRLEAGEDLPADALVDRDVLILYHTQQRTLPSHRALLQPWFEQGRPVVLSHCGIGAYPDWQEFRRWSGRYWVWGHEPAPHSRHPHVPCQLKVLDERFRVGWEQGWLPTDEMYLQLGEASATIPLVEAVAEDGSRECYAWQVREHPNVVAWLPGHRADMFRLPVVREGLEAALELAVRSARS